MRRANFENLEAITARNLELRRVYDTVRQFGGIPPPALLAEIDETRQQMQDQPLPMSAYTSSGEVSAPYSGSSTQ